MYSKKTRKCQLKNSSKTPQREKKERQRRRQRQERKKEGKKEQKERTAVENDRQSSASKQSIQDDAAT